MSSESRRVGISSPFGSLWEWSWAAAIVAACATAVAACATTAAAADESAHDLFSESPVEAEPAETEGAPPETEGAPAEGQQTVREIREAVEAGRYEEAITLAKQFVRNARSEAMKTEAIRLVAVAQRKKKDWDLAQAAYLTFRDRHAKGADAYVRASAIVEILRASRDGVYHPLVEEGDGEGTPTVDDDAVLEKALACLARRRAERLRVRLPRVRRAGSVEVLLKHFLPLAEELRHLRLIWPGRSRTLDRAAIQTGAMRLETLSTPMLAALKEKAALMQSLLRTRRLNTSEQAQMRRYRHMAEQLAAAENSFLAAVHRLGGTADWPEGLKLAEEASTRRDAYADAAKTLTPAPAPQRDRKGEKRKDDRGRREWMRGSP